MSDSPQPITLEFLARQQAQMLAELAAMHDELRVTIAIAQRLDGTVPGLVNEVRAMHAVPWE